MKPTLSHNTSFVKREAQNGMSVSVGLPSCGIPPIIGSLFSLFGSSG
jgi:hypothetical protein